MIRKLCFTRLSLVGSRKISSVFAKTIKFPHLVITRLHSIGRHDDQGHNHNQEHNHEHKHDHEHEHEHNHDNTVMVAKQKSGTSSPLTLPATVEAEDPEADMEDMFIQGPAGIEWGGPTRGGKRPEPTRYGDWERKGRATDFK